MQHLYENYSGYYKTQNGTEQSVVFQLLMKNSILGPREKYSVASGQRIWEKNGIEWFALFHSIWCHVNIWSLSRCSAICVTMCINPYNVY